MKLLVASRFFTVLRQYISKNNWFSVIEIGQRKVFPAGKLPVINKSKYNSAFELLFHFVTKFYSRVDLRNYCYVH